MVLQKTTSWMLKSMYLEIKVKMELLDLDFHFFHMLNLIMFSTKKEINGNIINHNMKIDMLCPISSNIVIVIGCSFEYFTYYIFILVILFMKICHEMWTTWTLNINKFFFKWLDLQNASQV
jgi:hypothetical protein